eukprot:gnl/TRDRNA2_/TRDRNA2_176981_c1_seq33.p1 gnl/TRDRNA2_/TRDRNA2_176981_c1~~gnl/TRDRNA2_/TRDRNA2_176981_c1_seq33.p1  ORF type:complete len:111 (-),score=37.24 gnl/TRDRNA2_/TRDRNA2_176981_c1_seq33:65-397(-)
MKAAQFAVAALALLVAASGEVQDPCAGCDEGLAQSYQKCAMEFGNPCAIHKKDISCCMKKEKHDRCLQCNSMDCSHGTCAAHMNQKYYSERTLEGTFDDKAAMKESGWGL